MTAIDRDAGMKIIEAYDALVDRAIDVTWISKFYATVDGHDLPRLSIDGETATISWREYESDYYEGGSCVTERMQFPSYLLFLSDADFDAFAEKAKNEVAEREAKVRAAQEAVERDRREAHDRAEWARLRAKFGGAP